MVESARFGAVVVLYQPSSAQIANIHRLRKICSCLVVVDNSPLRDLRTHASFVDDGIDVLINRNDGGVAGAFNRGLEHLLERDCAVLFLLDQDSQAPANFFVQMMQACAKLQSSDFLIGPKIFDINLKRYLPSLRFSRFGARRIDVAAAPLDQLLPCSFLISSGAAISASTYRRLGPLREDYFIDHVDTEYCLRACSHAVPLFINTSVRLPHAIGEKVEHRLLGFIKLRAMNHGALRRYYFARNGLHVSRLYARGFPMIVLVNLLTLGQAVAILLFEQDKRNKLLMLLKGVSDGLRGRSGPFSRLHPATPRRRHDDWN